MHLLIISHTEHYRSNGHYVGWGSTVRELDHLAAHFGRVTHVACLYEEEPAPPSAVAYQNKNVRFVPIPGYGGSGWRAKARIFTVAPRIIATVLRELPHADVFQFRAPTAMGLYLIPLLSWLVTKKGWYKYAGNWAQEDPPLAYWLQRFLLKHLNRRKVTVNGRWPAQQSHIYTFENPCLEKADRNLGQKVLAQKNYAAPLTACFVGRLDEAKGVGRILEAAPQLYAKGVRRVHMVGDGPLRAYYAERASASSIEFVFHGFLNRPAVFTLLEKSQLFLLPSNSEGFPKVIAEAANFGCVPLVSDVSSIGQYVNNSNGYLWRLEEGGFNDFITKLPPLQYEVLKNKAIKAYHLVRNFTFSHYCQRLEKEIIKRT